MTHRSVLAGIFALLAISPLHGQAILPSKPESRIAPHSKVERIEFWTEVGMLAGAWTADGITTSRVFAHCADCVEQGDFFAGERSTMKSQAAWAGIDIAAVVIAWEWKQHVHNRFLHPLWRVWMGQRTLSHAGSAWQNSRLAQTHPQNFR